MRIVTMQPERSRPLSLAAVQAEVDMMAARLRRLERRVDRMWLDVAIGFSLGALVGVLAAGAAMIGNL